MATPRVYVICDSNCKFESMTKEQILSAIMQAVNDGTISNIDAGFVTKIKEQNAGKNFKIWTGTAAQYLAIPAANIDEECLYIITDDTEIDDIKARLADLEAAVEQGGASSDHAKTADYANSAGNAETAQTVAFGENPAGIFEIALIDSADGKMYIYDNLYYFNGKIEGRITDADHADYANEAENADHATTADKAGYGGSYWPDEHDTDGGSIGNGLSGKFIFNGFDFSKGWYVAEFTLKIPIYDGNTGTYNVCKFKTRPFSFDNSTDLANYCYIETYTAAITLKGAENKVVGLDRMRTGTIAISFVLGKNNTLYIYHETEDGADKYIKFNGIHKLEVME